jgi:malonyl CoA-acyl carrier protein transacylase
MFMAERQFSTFLDDKIRHFCVQLGAENAKKLLDFLDSSNPSNEDHPAAVAQCALFAICQSIWALLREAGICQMPSTDVGLLFGHSFGEFGALCAAGAIKSEEGIRLLWKRAELIERGTEPTKMIMIRRQMQRTNPFEYDEEAEEVSKLG